MHAISFDPSERTNDMIRPEICQTGWLLVEWTAKKSAENIYGKAERDLACYRCFEIERQIPQSIGCQRSSLRGSKSPDNQRDGQRATFPCLTLLCQQRRPCCVSKRLALQGLAVLG